MTYKPNNLFKEQNGLSELRIATQYLKVTIPVILELLTDNPGELYCHGLQHRFH